MIYTDTIALESLVGKTVRRANLRQIGIILAVERRAPAPTYPYCQVRWASGKTDWVQTSALYSLDDEVEAAQRALAELMSARDRARALVR